jgi:hypothetical protein
VCAAAGTSDRAGDSVKSASISVCVSVSVWVGVGLCVRLQVLGIEMGGV